MSTLRQRATENHFEWHGVLQAYTVILAFINKTPSETLCTLAATLMSPVTTKGSDICLM